MQPPSNTYPRNAAMCGPVQHPLPGKKRRTLPRLRVAARIGDRFAGKLIAGASVSPCVLGPAGIRQRKREGDGATPAGIHRLQNLLFRPDRGPRPPSALPASGIGRHDGWCDDPSRPRYNRPVNLPFAGSHERLWREDRLYDLLVILDFNMRPARKGRGSAIFLHLRASTAAPTAGCIAVEPAVLRRLLHRIGPQTRIVVG